MTQQRDLLSDTWLKAEGWGNIKLALKYRRKDRTDWAAAEVATKPSTDNLCELFNSRVVKWSHRATAEEISNRCFWLAGAVFPHFLSTFAALPSVSWMDSSKARRWLAKRCWLSPKTAEKIFLNKNLYIWQLDFLLTSMSMRIRTVGGIQVHKTCDHHMKQQLFEKRVISHISCDSHWTNKQLKHVLTRWRKHRSLTVVWRFLPKYVLIITDS